MAVRPTARRELLAPLGRTPMVRIASDLPGPHPGFWTKLEGLPRRGSTDGTVSQQVQQSPRLGGPPGMRDHVVLDEAADDALIHALSEFETHYNGHRPHRALGQAALLRSCKTWRSADDTDSAEPSTSTDVPRDQAE